MSPIIVRHTYYSGSTEEHKFNSMQNALDFIHILHGEYHLEKIEILINH